MFTLSLLNLDREIHVYFSSSLDDAKHVIWLTFDSSRAFVKKKWAFVKNTDDFHICVSPPTDSQIDRGLLTEQLQNVGLSLIIAYFENSLLCPHLCTCTRRPFASSGTDRTTVSFSVPLCLA